MVSSCAPCQHHQNQNTKEPMISHDIPQKPWFTLGADLFYWNGSHYLLVCDYYSKFPLVCKLSNCESCTTIAHLKSMFEEHGIPNKLITGNDTQFTSNLFLKFSHTYGFNLVTTSPTATDDRRRKMLSGNSPRARPSLWRSPQVAKTSLVTISP